jgi:hypothetical protein
MFISYRDGRTISEFSGANEPALKVIYTSIDAPKSSLTFCITLQQLIEGVAN